MRTPRQISQQNKEFMDMQQSSMPIKTNILNMLLYLTVKNTYNRNTLKRINSSVIGEIESLLESDIFS